jgi:mannosyltransferase OCH1-like enzyme
MIPKIIHYTWFSGDEMPQVIKECIASWKRILPEYELRLWDYNAIKDIDSVFLKEALEVKKWAYAADFVRLYALYNEGGIYLDTDVMVFKRFDCFLNDKCFI